MTKGESLIRDGMSRKERRGKGRGGVKKRNGCDGHRCRFAALTRRQLSFNYSFFTAGKLGLVVVLRRREATTDVGASGVLRVATVREVGLGFRLFEQYLSWDSVYFTSYYICSICVCAISG